MFAQSVTICEILTVKMFMILALTFRMGLEWDKVEYKYAHGKAV